MGQFLSLFARFWKVKFWTSFILMSIFQWRLGGFSQKNMYRIFISLSWAFFRKREKLGSHTGSKWWPGDPMTQFHVCEWVKAHMMHDSECDIQIWWTRGWKCRTRAHAPRFICFIAWPTTSLKYDFSSFLTSVNNYPNVVPAIVSGPDLSVWRPWAGSLLE